jgi:hypothetical protein
VRNQWHRRRIQFSERFWLCHRRQTSIDDGRFVIRTDKPILIYIFLDTPRPMKMNRRPGLWMILSSFASVIDISIFHIVHSSTIRFCSSLDLDKMDFRNPRKGYEGGVVTRRYDQIALSALHNPFKNWWCFQYVRHDLLRRSISSPWKWMQSPNLHWSRSLHWFPVITPGWVNQSGGHEFCEFFLTLSPWHCDFPAISFRLNPFPPMRPDPFSVFQLLRSSWLYIIARNWMAFNAASPSDQRSNVWSHNLIKDSAESASRPLHKLSMPISW